MKKTTLIIFDIDGTLTDSVYQHQKAFTETLLDIGVSHINKAFKSFKHHTDRFIAQDIYQENQKKTFSEEKQIEFEHGLTEKITRLKFNEILGAKDLILNLENQPDIAICFATGSLKRPAEHKLRSVGISFKEWQLVASDYIPERENIVQQAIKNASEYYEGITFKRIVSVGDGLWDLLTACHLGLEFIGVGEVNKAILLEHGAEIVYKNLTEFKLKPIEYNLTK